MPAHDAAADDFVSVAGGGMVARLAGSGAPPSLQRARIGGVM